MQQASILLVEDEALIRMMLSEMMDELSGMLSWRKQAA
jgi:CheY-like chemotaxis protein